MYRTLTAPRFSFLMGLLFWGTLTAFSSNAQEMTRNAQKDSSHVNQEGTEPGRLPSGAAVKMDPDTMTYHARPLTPAEIEKAKKGIEDLYRQKGYK